MSKLTLSEALEIVPIGKTKLYQDAKNGIITTEKDYQGKKVVDVSELQRVYGKLRNPETDIERTEPNRTPMDRLKTGQNRVRISSQ